MGTFHISPDVIFVRNNVYQFDSDIRTFFHIVKPILLLFDQFENK